MHDLLPESLITQVFKKKENASCLVSTACIQQGRWLLL
jgi:hypothetical protein